MSDKKKCPGCGENIHSEWTYHNKCGWKGEVEQKEEQHFEQTTNEPKGIHITKEGVVNALKSTGNFFWSNKLWFLLIIAIFFAGFVRYSTFNTPVTETWANEASINLFKNQISAQIDQQYPNLPDADKERLIELEFQKVPKEQIEAVKVQAKAYFDDQLRYPNGHPYLHDIDTWQHLRRAENVAEHGNMGDEYEGNGAVNGMKDLNGTLTAWDGLRNAPYGTRAAGNVIHVYLTAYTYKFLNLFTEIPITDVLFLVPVFLSALSVIPAFFIGRKFAGDIGGFFAGMLVGCHPQYVIRTMGGVADTDVYPILFGLLVAWFFLESMESPTMKKRLIWGILAGITVGIFTFTWSGWWYILLLSLGTIGVCAGYSLLKKDYKDIKNYALIGALMVFLPMGVYFLLKGEIITLITDSNIFEFLQLKDIATKTLYPNINVTIAEMMDLSFGGIVERFGVLMFWLSIIAIPLTVIKKRNGKRDITFAVFFAAWLAATIFASLRGIRFTMLMVPPWGISLGIFFGLAIEWLSEIAPKIQLKKGIATLLLFIVGCVIIATPISTSYNIVKQSGPSVTDAWYNALDKIDKEANKDAIINSWWDFGHWFTQIGKRRVTFDGAHQVGYGAYWMGHALMTEDEDLAVGILRMLDCGANTAEEKLNYYLGHHTELDGNPETIDILNRVLGSGDYDTAKKKLAKYAPSLTEEQITDVLKYMYCEPPENFFVTSTDMIGKASVWGHFGLWDFDKAEIYSVVAGKTYAEKVRILKEEFNKSESEAQKIANDILSYENNPDIKYPGDRWISPYPQYISAGASCQDGGNNTLRCMNGAILIDKNSWDITVYEQGVAKKPELFYFFKDGIYYQKKGDFPNMIPIEVSLVNVAEDYYVTMTTAGGTAGLGKSVFEKLFFYGGQGLHHFKLFTHTKSVSGENIIVWRVDWTGDNYYGDGSTYHGEIDTQTQGGTENGIQK